MAEKAGVHTRAQESNQKCSNFCIHNPGYNSSGSPADRVLQLQRTAGNQAVQRLIKSGSLEVKLRISQPDDVNEQEADRVAEQIMRMSDPVLQKQKKPEEEKEEIIPTKPLVNHITPPIQRRIDEEEEKEEPIQRKEETRMPLIDGVPLDQVGNLEPVADFEAKLNASSRGSPLPASTRAFMEARFEADFSRVRLHTDNEAAQLSRVINAQAFTHGRDIYLAEGKNDLDSSKGKQLLSHELVHVLQQRGEQVLPGQEVGDNSRIVSVVSPSPLQIQRVPSSYDVAEQKKLIEEGIRDEDIGKIKDVEPNAFALASDIQAIKMIQILLNQSWVGPRDETAIYGIWKSRGKDLIDLASRYTGVWVECLNRGVDMIWTIPDLEPVRTEFKQAVAGRAREYLDVNKKTVDSELKRYGLDNMAAAPPPEKAQEREKMMAAAVAVKKAKDAIEKMDRMLVGYDHVVGTPQNNKVERCAALFNPAAPPPLPGHVPVPAEEGAVLPSWDDTRKNYERAHAVIDHYTSLYPALVALREDTELKDVARSAVSSEEAANNLMAMQVLRQALNETRTNIDKTYGLVNDPKGEFALELQPIHEQFFLFDSTWKGSFRQMVVRAAIKEHGNVEFWNTIGVSTIGAALFVVAELSTGGLATFFFAAAAAGGIAQAAASWDKYFTLKAAAGTNLNKETSLISREQASDQLLTAALDTVMAFVDIYTAAKGGMKALGKVGEAEAKFAGIAGKEAAIEEKFAKHEFKFHDSFRNESHGLRIRSDGIFEICSDKCGIFEKRIRERLDSLAGGPPWGDFKETTDELILRAQKNDIASIKVKEELEALTKFGERATDAQKEAMKKLEEEWKKLGEAQKQIERELEAVEEKASKGPNRDPITGEPKELLQPSDPLEFDPKTLEFTDPVTGVQKRGFATTDAAKSAFERSEGTSLSLDPSGFTKVTAAEPGWKGISQGHCGVYKGGRYVGTIYQNVYQGHTFYTFSRGAH